jgi:hypothetical protein
MAKASYNDRAYQSFTANVPADLVGKEGYVVELVAAKRTIQLYTATSGVPPLGVLCNRLEGDTAWNVRLLGRAASVRMVAGGSIAANAQVKAANGGTIVSASGGDKAIGVSIDGTAHVSGDVLEVADSYFTAY